MVYYCLFTGKPATGIRRQAVTTTFTSVGRSFVHGEGPEKVTGHTVYGVDVTRPGMLWGKTLRSPLPHARIVSIDTSRAKAMPGAT